MQSFNTVHYVPVTTNIDIAMKKLIFICNYDVRLSYDTYVVKKYDKFVTTLSQVRTMLYVSDW